MMRRRYIYLTMPLFILLFAFFLYPGLTRTGAKVKAASVTCKSKYYVTTVVGKSKLKKGKKTRVTVKVKNTSGKDMKNLTVKVTLPSRLKKTSGKLSKSKASLKNGKSWSFSFYVKAKKQITFKKKVTTTMKVSGSATTITAKNLVRYGVEDKYMRVKASFDQPEQQAAPAQPTTTKPETPAVTPASGAYNVTKLSDVKNFMAILDPDNYSKKKDYLDALKNTDYDLIFIDLFFDETPLTNSEVASLKKKKNGGTRMVCAYFSVGEAENYRYYWQKGWKKNNPEWIADENPDWEGNYKVKYWYPEWQSILYGDDIGSIYTEKSYLDNIIEAGFDGVYLDVIDAYEYFEKKNIYPFASDPSSCASSMINLLADMNTYAKNKKAGFAMISNGGYYLYHPSSATKTAMLAAVDGVLIEDAFSDDDSTNMQKALTYAKANNRPAFTIEYEKGHARQSEKLGYISYTGSADEGAPEELNKIPEFTVK